MDCCFHLAPRGVKLTQALMSALQIKTLQRFPRVGAPAPGVRGKSARCLGRGSGPEAWLQGGWPLWVMCVWLLVPWPSALAHAEFEAQIAALTVEIRKEPTNAALFLRRADWYRLHVEVDKSLADLAEAERLAPGSVMPALGRAQLFSDVGRIPDALNEACAVLKQKPSLPEALAIRARCKVKQGAVHEAIPDLSSALEHYSAPSPDLYLERARLQAALGRLDDAVKGLDAGLVRIGAAPALQLAAIEYERQQAKFDAALARVERIAEKYTVKESWLLLRGEILAQAGRNTEAIAALKTVLAGIENYSPTRRSLDQTQQLEARTREAWARIEGKPPQVL